MRRSWTAGLRLALLALSMCISASAQSPNLVVMAKEGSGVITRASMGLTLKSIQDGDQTQSFIPDGSKLVSDNLRTEAVNHQLPAGTYRMRFEFSFIDSGGQIISKSASSFSAPFTVR